MIGETNAMTEGFIFELAAAGGLVWAAFTFHWGRIAACSVALAVWGVGAVGVPLYMAGIHMTHGSPAAALATVALGCVTAFLWWIGATAAYRWAQRNDHLGTLWLPWNAR